MNFLGDGHRGIKFKFPFFAFAGHRGKRHIPLIELLVRYIDSVISPTFDLFGLDICPEKNLETGLFIRIHKPENVLVIFGAEVMHIRIGTPTDRLSKNATDGLIAETEGTADAEKKFGMDTGSVVRRLNGGRRFKEVPHKSPGLLIHAFGNVILDTERSCRLFRLMAG